MFTLHVLACESDIQTNTVLGKVTWLNTYMFNYLIYTTVLFSYSYTTFTVIQQDHFSLAK